MNEHTHGGTCPACVKANERLAAAEARAGELEAAIRADLAYHEWQYTADSDEVVRELPERREAVLALQRRALGAGEGD